MTTICYLWSNCAVLWKEANWLWSQCFTTPDTGSISLGVPGVDASLLGPQWVEEPWNPYKKEEKKERLMELICRGNGFRYETEKKVKKISLTVGGIKMAMNPSDVDVEFKLEE
jgi:hypothetical protein